MSKTIRISVIIPVFNSQDYLSKCIDSLIDELDVGDEIILVDDGSTDNSGEICCNYSNRYPDTIKVIHQKNEGPFIARINGFRHARGDYLIAIDSDDMFECGGLSVITSAIMETKSDVLIWGYSSKGSEQIERAKINCVHKKRLTKDEAIFELCTTYKHNPMWSKAVKRCCAALDEDYSAYKGMTACEDFLQTLFVFDRAEEFWQIDEPLYFYRQNPKSITHGRYKESHFNDTLTATRVGLTYASRWENEFGIEGLRAGIISRGLVSQINYARELALSGARSRWIELSKTSITDDFSLFKNAVDSLGLLKRLELRMLQHCLYYPHRLISILLNHLKF